MALKQTPPNLQGVASVEFVKNDFDAAIWNKGYTIEIEHAVECPCKGLDQNPLAACQNCLGLGFAYINPFSMRAIATGINTETQNKEWSLEKIGTISLSTRDDQAQRERFSFQDRVTLVKRRETDQERLFAMSSEVRELRVNSTGGKFSFMTYKPQQILEIWTFDGSTNKLIKLSDALYSISEINPYVVNFDASVSPTNRVVSIRYEHDIQYIVIDIPHEVRHSTTKDKNGREQTIVLPMQAVARRVHFSRETPNYDGSGIKNNSYE